MSNVKSHHIFEKGEMVFIHPIVELWHPSVFVDTFSKNETAIVTETLKAEHPRKDFRKIKVFLPVSSRFLTIPANMAYHVHAQEYYEDKCLKFYDMIKDCFKDYIYGLTSTKILRASSFGTYTEKEKFRNMCSQNNLHIRNPCKAPLL